jgi:hypothetical protein
MQSKLFTPTPPFTIITLYTCTRFSPSPPIPHITYPVVPATDARIRKPETYPTTQYTDPASRDPSHIPLTPPLLRKTPPNTLSPRRVIQHLQNIRRTHRAVRPGPTTLARVNIKRARRPAKRRRELPFCFASRQAEGARLWTSSCRGGGGRLLYAIRPTPIRSRCIERGGASGITRTRRIKIRGREKRRPRRRILPTLRICNVLVVDEDFRNRKLRYRSHATLFLLVLGAAEAAGPV